MSHLGTTPAPRIGNAHRRRLAGTVGHLALTAVLALGLLGCGSDNTGPDTASDSGSPESEVPRDSAEIDEPGASTGDNPNPTQPAEPTQPTGPDPEIGPVPEQQWRAMVDAGMVRPECPIQERAQLRRVDINHVGFDGQTSRGHVVVHRDTAETTARIFSRLYEMDFPIRRMVSVEAYDGDVAASLADDNTSAFNCRQPDQINAPFTDSPHANGRAVDVNPRENPWMDLRCDCWVPGPRYAERTPGSGKILDGDEVWQTFIDEGWIWQNIDVADYMHFDTGYPSRPYARP